MATKPATKQPRKKKTMKFGEDLGQPKRRPSSGRPKKENGSRKKRSEESHEDEDHYDDKICVLCCEEIEFFAKGSCDHVVCFRCSSRMRALCDEMYCAVCRLELKKVLFTENNVPFVEVDLKKLPSEEKYGIVFQNEIVRNKYKELLRNDCSLCKEKKDTFDELRRHMRHKHERQYCDICVKNLKIFPHEFRVYTRSELVLHRKTGDPDNRSYKGHPQCDFCSERYYDNDELLLHLRKNHFWCHFCEKDGKQEYYYNYDELRSHFRDEHFLCEENECIHEKYTSVFRSDIDYQAHKLAKHSKKLTKLAAKQARQVNVEIDYGKRRVYKQKVYSERPGASRQETELSQRSARYYRGSEDNGAVGAFNDAAKERANRGSKASPAVANENGTKNSNFEGKALNVQAPAFVPSVPDAAKEAEVPSTTEVAKAQTKVSKPEPKDKQWAQVVGVPNDQNYGADFPSIDNGGARPKTSPPSQRSTKKAGKKGKKVNKVVVDSEKLQSTNSETPPDEIKDTKGPPGLGKDKVVPSKLPPGINVPGNVSSSGSASSVPPGLTGGNETYCGALVLNGKTTETSGSTQGRNAALVGLIRNLISAEDFNKFRDYSGSFRRSEIDGTSYYRFIKSIFGENLDLVFNELVDLLPDKEKQNQLLKLHVGLQMFPILSGGERPGAEEPSKGPRSSEPKQAWKGRSLSESPKSSVPAKQTAPENGVITKDAGQVQGNSNLTEQSKKRKEKDFHVCGICGFPVSKKGLESHMVIHAESDFPSLPTFNKPKDSWNKRKTQVPVHNAWAKSS